MAIIDRSQKAFLKALKEKYAVEGPVVRIPAPPTRCPKCGLHTISRQVDPDQAAIMRLHPASIVALCPRCGHTGIIPPKVMGR